MKNQRDLPVLNRSSRSFFASFCAATFLVALSNSVGRDDILEVDVERVTRRHEVSVVDVLDERLASRALGLLLFIHLLRHLCVFNRA